jgi:hypothetical protein
LGVIDRVKDRICPISGAVGLQLMVKIDDKLYEVRVAPVKVVKMYGTVFQKGETVEIVSVMTPEFGCDLASRD